MEQQELRDEVRTRLRSVLTSTHEKVFSAGGDLAGFSADVPLIRKFFATDRFPREAYDALAASGFHAPHVP